MNRPTDPLEHLAGRVTELEFLLTHLQRTVHDLDEVVLAQQRRLDGLELQVQRLLLAAEHREAVEDRRSAEEERPPHY